MGTAVYERDCTGREAIVAGLSGFLAGPCPLALPSEQRLGVAARLVRISTFVCADELYPPEPESSGNLDGGDSVENVDGYGEEAPG